VGTIIPKALFFASPHTYISIASEMLDKIDRDIGVGASP
jgi:hypothetical protein